ncbi:MAG: pilin [Patescibacteria group bacterium]
MQTLQKKCTSYATKAFINLSLTVPALLSFSLPAHAEALKGDQLFGGAADSGAGNAFASDAGLGSTDLVTTIASIIQTALGFLGIIAVVIILLGGFKWMTSGGNEDKVKGAKKLIFSGIIGLVIVLSSFAIAQFVVGNLSSATTKGG